MFFSPFLKAAGHSFASLLLVAEKIGGRGTSMRNSPHSNNGGQVQPSSGTGMTWGRASATTNSRLFTEPLPRKPAPTIVQTHRPTPSRWRTAYSPDSQGDNMERSNRWRYIRRIAWDRDRKDRAPCHICGQPIDYFLRPSSCDDAWEPDHVIPVAKRKDLELDLNNIKASHRRCNRARGDGSGMENELGMQSRIW